MKFRKYQGSSLD